VADVPSIGMGGVRRIILSGDGGADETRRARVFQCADVSVMCVRACGPARSAVPFGKPGRVCQSSGLQRGPVIG